MNLESLLSERKFNSTFRKWRRVAEMLETKKMPPPDAEQPSNRLRSTMVQSIRQQLESVAKNRSGDPGKVVLRRLTSAEFNYTIHDLTGLDLQLDRELPGDAVGGEGFANIGIVQFMQDSTLEQYLQTARRIADHAVVGSGPIQFFKDPGKTGFELSAINRIQSIYRAHGFRTGAGEGGEPFGMDRYPKAFFVAWQFKNRDELGIPTASIESLSRAEGIDTRFVRHLWSVLHDDQAVFPTQEIIKRWNDISVTKNDVDDVRSQCEELYQFLLSWQKRLSDSNSHFEEAVVLSEQDVKLTDRHRFEFRTQIPDDQKVLRLHFRIGPIDASASDPVVRWNDLSIEFRQRGKRWDSPLEFFKVAKVVGARQETVQGDEAGEFLMNSKQPVVYEIAIPPGRVDVRFAATAQLETGDSASSLALCAVTQDASDWQSEARLIVDPKSDSVTALTQGIRRFVRDLPQISQREPAPSDRDPIPRPFDATYNNPERDHFHYKVKYCRDDSFLVEKILDDETRTQLDHAWCDLLTSFEYHDIFLKFTAKKFELELPSDRISEITQEWLSQLNNEPREIISRLWHNWKVCQNRLNDAHSTHLSNLLDFASKAWRRPLTDLEEIDLQTFYKSQRQHHRLDHAAAIRASLVRIIMSPRFLYRSEAPNESVDQLSPSEIASRLSYFLWSSIPDQELREMVDSGDLLEAESLKHQVVRMLKDPKAARLGHEFFGQWFGFYRFDQYGGVDEKRFPEFTASLKDSMFGSANRFFEYIVRNDRPVRDILFSDYAYLNQELARHYGLEISQEAGFQRLNDVSEHHRGGLLGLGAVLTSTSAPLRTSPVKRGDWILRRIVGTPVPPPPADAGSIAADDVTGDGLTVGQRLEAHRNDASCASCHTRIDPLGFALENFDAIGRWRNTYRDGQTVENTGTLLGGHNITGPDGLRAYLKRNENQFFETFCHKLLGYALGRSVLLSDSELIDKMLTDIQKDAPFSELVQRVVTSPQFLNSQFKNHE